MYCTLQRLDEVLPIAADDPKVVPRTTAIGNEDVSRLVAAD